MQAKEKLIKIKITDDGSIRLIENYILEIIFGNMLLAGMALKYVIITVKQSGSLRMLF